MKALVGKPVNDVQREYNALCMKGGGAGGGPARSKVLELLRHFGQKLNGLAYAEAEEHMKAFPEANPWHVCFAVALAWGHMAKLDLAFTAACVGLLSNWNSADLKVAKGFHLERGAAPIENSLTGAFMVFNKIVLPPELPTTLVGIDRAQQRWLGGVLTGPNRPPYIGAWNGTAMFMVALFAQPTLAATQRHSRPALPHGGPIHAGLNYLHKGNVVSKAPSGGPLDDAAFEPGIIYENNNLFEELCAQRPDWSLIDVHSGVYLLGTNDKRSQSWIS